MSGFGSFCVVIFVAKLLLLCGSLVFVKHIAASIACNRLWWTLAVEQASFQSSVLKLVLNGYELCVGTTLLLNIVKNVAFMDIKFVSLYG